MAPHLVRAQSAYKDTRVHSLHHTHMHTPRYTHTHTANTCITGDGLVKQQNQRHHQHFYLLTHLVPSFFSSWSSGSHSPDSSWMLWEIMVFIFFWHGCVKCSESCSDSSSAACTKDTRGAPSPSLWSVIGAFFLNNSSSFKICKFCSCINVQSLTRSRKEIFSGWHRFSFWISFGLENSSGSALLL